MCERLGRVKARNSKKVVNKSKVEKWGPESPGFQELKYWISDQMPLLLHL